MTVFNILPNDIYHQTFFDTDGCDCDYCTSSQKLINKKSSKNAHNGFICYFTRHIA